MRRGRRGTVVFVIVTSIYLCGNETFEEHVPVFRREVKTQNKYELLDDDNDKREPRGVQSVSLPPSLTRLKKISSRRVRPDGWRRLEPKTDNLDRLPVPFVHWIEK